MLLVVYSKQSESGWRRVSCVSWFAWSARTFLFYSTFSFCIVSKMVCPRVARNIYDLLSGGAIPVGLGTLFLFYFFLLLILHCHRRRCCHMLPPPTVHCLVVFSFPIVCVHFLLVIRSIYFSLQDWITLVCVEQFGPFVLGSCAPFSNRGRATKKKTNLSWFAF